MRLLLLCVAVLSSTQSVLAEQVPDSAVSKRQTVAPPTGLLTNFQVEAPVLTPSGSGDEYGCIYTKLLMDHSFGYSYGVPFVGKLPTFYFLI